LIGRDFVAGETGALVLGDNIFHGAGLTALLRAAGQRTLGATVLPTGCVIPDRFGNCRVDRRWKCHVGRGKPVGAPFRLGSHWPLFLRWTDQPLGRAETSKRGELRSTDLIDTYLPKGALHVERLGRGITWFDFRKPTKQLLRRRNFHRLIEERQH